MDIRIPNLGEGAESGVVVNIHVKVGDKITKDQTLIELENEKAVAPIPSTAAGVVSKIYVKAGDKVSVGQPVLALAQEGLAPQAPTAPSSPISVAAAPATSAATPAPAATVAVTAQLGTYQYVSAGGFEPPASPSIRKMALDLGIDLGRIKGSENGGRIILEDVKKYIVWLQSVAFSSTPSSAPVSGTPLAARTPAESIDFAKWGAVSTEALSSLRQKISDKMTESWTTIPHVTQFEEADITDVLALRKKYAPMYEKKGARLTLTGFVIKAVISALKKYPQVNASLDEKTREYVLKQYFNLGIAVDTEQGLIVPVLKNADKKSMLELSKELDALAEKTRQRKVGAEDLKGGSFTISNLGGIGGTFFTPIINKPEVAILGVGRGVTKPVIPAARGKAKPKIEARTMLPLGLSYDHRVIDGADGARFIRQIAETLENFKIEDVKL